MEDMEMSVRDLIPWGRTAAPAPASPDAMPFLSLHRDINRLFDDMFRGFDMPAEFGSARAFGASWPNVEISETDKDVRIAAEVPGLDEKDIEVVLDEGVLTIRGEKKAETEDKDRHFSERYYGRFERRIGVGPEVDRDKVEASFKNGVLKVTLPKTEKAKSQSKRIPIAKH
jgi:HSP20 family protein